MPSTTLNGTYCGLCHQVTYKPLYAQRDTTGTGFTSTLICEECFEKSCPPLRWWERDVPVWWYLAAAGIGSFLGSIFWRAVL